MAFSQNLAVCVTCGTQYDFNYEDRPETCRMCNEPRQFVPPSGQSWTTLAKIRGTYTNEIKQDEADGRIWSIFSRPQFAIGQRALFIQTEAGNILWDCITNLDQETIRFIKARGGLKAIAISHPHFYSTHLEWAREFDCPVYLAAEDQEWLNRVDSESRRIFYKGETIEILPGATMVKLGGHFPGSSALFWNGNLFVGDSIGISQSGLIRSHHSERHQVFFFQYAFPNFIPLGPTAMHEMWKRLKPWDFKSLYSLFYVTTVRDPDVKKVVLDSMQRQARHQENANHPLLKEVWPISESHLGNVQVAFYAGNNQPVPSPQSGGYSPSLRPHSLVIGPGSKDQPGNRETQNKTSAHLLILVIDAGDDELANARSIHLAASASSIGEIKALLRRGGESPSEKTIQSLLSAAIENSEPSIIEFLLTEYPSVLLEEDLVRSAVGTGSIPVFKALLARDPAVINMHFDKYGSPLTVACMRQKPVEYLRFLLEAGADPNQDPDAASFPLALVAAFYNDTTAIDLLLQHGARVEHSGALASAAQLGNEPMLRRLLVRGARLDTDADGLTNVSPLHCAVKKGHVGIARILLEHGADANVADASGITAIEIATQMNFKGQDMSEMFEVLGSKSVS